VDTPPVGDSVIFDGQLRGAEHKNESRDPSVRS
jgi:hypothetical protein